MGLLDVGSVYRLGAVLLKLDEPDKVIGRTKFPIMEPEMDYEKFGIVNNVVFTCGAVVMKSRLYIYYGAADKVIGGASISLQKLLKSLTEN